MDDVYEHYGLHLTPDRGGERRAECPLPEHDDEHPSACVRNADDNDRELFWCNTCREGGDVYVLIQRREALAGYPAAAEFAARVFDSSNDEVGRERGASAFMPRSSRNRKTRGGYVPPWSRL